MKMRRIFAMLLAMVMAFAMITGCSKKASKEPSASTPGGENVNSVVQTLTIKVNDIEGMNGEVTLTLKGLDGASSISVNGSLTMEGKKLDLNFDDVLTIVKDKVYINVEELLSVMDEVPMDDMEMGMGMGIDVSSIASLIDAEWVYIEMPGMSDSVKIDTSIQDGLLESLMEGLASLGTTEGDTTTYKLESMDDYIAVMEALVSAMEDNKDAWVDFSYETSTGFDTEALMEGIVDELAGAMAEMYGGLVTEAQLKEQLMQSMDTSAMEISKEDIEASLDMMIGELENAIEKMEDMEIPATTEIKTTLKDKGYTFSVTMSTEDMGSLEVYGDVTVGAAVTIQAPSGAKDLMGMISDLMSDLMSSMGGLMQ